jgi:hypothetical protein
VLVWSNNVKSGTAGGAELHEIPLAVETLAALPRKQLTFALPLAFTPAG